MAPSNYKKYEKISFLGEGQVSYLLEILLKELI